MNYVLKTDSIRTYLPQTLDDGSILTCSLLVWNGERKGLPKKIALRVYDKNDQEVSADVYERNPINANVERTVRKGGKEHGQKRTGARKTRKG
jgi:hypothetical protein